MKKFQLLALVSLFGLVACGDKDEDTGHDDHDHEEHDDHDDEDHDDEDHD